MVFILRLQRSLNLGIRGWAEELVLLLVFHSVAQGTKFGSDTNFVGKKEKNQFKTEKILRRSFSLKNRNR